MVTGDQDFGNNPDMSKRICKESLNSKSNNYEKSKAHGTS